jgi:beta-glucosidase
MATIHTTFPSDFVWGAATAAFQIEGATSEDGKGESIWDRFTQTPGKIIDSSNANVTCDSYHRYGEDVALLKSMNLGVYRFSVSWSRIIPTGIGLPNPKGIAYYDRLIDALLENNLEPFLTLYHWDLPQALQDRGGWANRDTAFAFADYAAVMTRHFGDRVKQWITHNEPWCMAFLGYYTGLFAPGITDLQLALQAAHHGLLSHGLAVSAMRANAPNALQIGISVNMEPAYPVSDSQADSLAARRHDGYINRWFLDPLTNRGYPSDMLLYYREKAPKVEAGDMDIMATPIDFIGVNYYNRVIAVDHPEGPPPQVLNRPDPAQPRTVDREIYPEGLYDVVMRLCHEYGFQSIYLTENGASSPDRVANDGQIHDLTRVQYLQDHFEQALRALNAGAPLKGYFIWSLMDNFEWAAGYTIRYGLAFTDYVTSRRILKNSGYWLRDYIAMSHAKDSTPIPQSVDGLL